MKNRKKEILAFFLAACMVLLSLPVFAASSGRPVLTDTPCSLNANYCYGETAFSGLEVRLYQIADISEDFKYTPKAPFGEYAPLLNGIQTSGEWNVLSSTFSALVTAKKLSPDALLKTDEKGFVAFTGLKTGLYLVISDHGVGGDLRCRFAPSLVTLPVAGDHGEWNYDVEVNAKGELLPPEDPEKEIRRKIVKLWNGDEDFARPESIQVDLFRDGTLFETVTLSKENNWVYHFTTKDDGALWSVSEKDVPQGYRASLEERGEDFVLTNTLIPTEEEPPQPPQTGDTTGVLFYALLLTLSGTVLVLLGVCGKRRKDEE